MKGPKDMTPREFAEWWLQGSLSVFDTRLRDQVTDALAARDAYRERQALLRVVERAAYGRCGKTGWEELRDAILGKPRFVPGQLVRRCVYRGDANGGPVYSYGVIGSSCFAPEAMEPVRVRIDAEDRAIVEDAQ